MNLDIHDTFVTAIILSVLGAIYCIWQGRRTLLAAQRVSFFRIRRQRVTGGWWMIFLGGVLIFVAFGLGRFGEPLVYRYFPPSPTVTRTPTITLTPTISLTPTITETPTITLTPAQSYTPTPSTTPFLPVNLLPAFKSSVTPNPSAVFSPLTFSRSIQNFVVCQPSDRLPKPDLPHICHVYLRWDGGRFPVYRPVVSEWTTGVLRELPLAGEHGRIPLFRMVPLTRSVAVRDLPGANLCRYGMEGRRPIPGPGPATHADPFPDAAVAHQHPDPLDYACAHRNVLPDPYTDTIRHTLADRDLGTLKRPVNLAFPLDLAGLLRGKHIG